MKFIFKNLNVFYVINIIKKTFFQIYKFILFYI